MTETPSEEYKASRYNHFAPVNDQQTGAINLLTNATLLLNNEDSWPLVQRLLSDRQPGPDEAEQELFTILVESKFLVPASFDELAYLKEVFECSKGSAVGFSLGIITSLQCNFRCPYCYQEHKDSRMSREVQLAVLSYLRRQLPGKMAFHVAWWGGEPLLEAQMIGAFGQEMMQLCDALGTRYTSSIISNCYLLTSDNIRVLAEARLNHLQVTLDGPKQFHNKRRFLIGGKGTYDVIIQGLTELLKELPELGITVRVNVSKGLTAIEPWGELLTDLRPFKRNIAIHYTPVAPAAIYDKLCMPKEVFDDFFQKIVRITQAQGFAITSGRKTPGSVFCGAIPTGNWLIHPRGYITKCTARMDSEEGSLGRLLPDGQVELNSEAPLWLGFTPFEVEECTKCDVLPTCMGGCLKIPMKGDAVLDRCALKSGIRYFLKDRIIRQQRLIELSSIQPAPPTSITAQVP